MTILSFPTFKSLTAPEDVARYNVQAVAPQAARFVSWGQVFAKGAIQPTTTLGTFGHVAQMDTKNLHDDGSVLFAVVTTKVPAFTGPAWQKTKLITTSTPATPPVNLANRLTNYDVRVELTGGIVQTIDIKMWLLNALSSGAASYWLRGQLAAQARVDIPITGSSHLVADVTAFNDGTFLTDLQFRNDHAMQTYGSKKLYTATIKQNGVVVYASPALTHHLYQEWRWVFGSADMKSPRDTHNVQHHIGDMVEAGVLLNYDTSSGIDSASIRGAASTNITPFSSEDILRYMPNTGGRDDIGIMPAWNARWLKSQDMSAAKQALANAAASGSVPWHCWDAVKKDYLSLDDYPTLWIDGGNRGPVDLTQWTEDATWTIDTAHAPALSFVPYLFTGDRYFLDQINAAASYLLLMSWYGRLNGKQYLFNALDQVRAQAWTFRAISEAAWAAPDSAPNKAYWNRMVDDSLDYVLVAIVPLWNTKAGEGAGYIFGDYASDGTGRLIIAPWQQEFVVSALGAAAVRGSAKAAQALTWMEGWALDRFAHGWRAAMSYNYYVTNSSGVYHKTWAALEAENGGTSNALPTDGGYWVPLALESLAILDAVTGNPVARTTYGAIKAANAPGTRTADYQSAYPQYHVVPK